MRIGEKSFTLGPHFILAAIFVFNLLPFFWMGSTSLKTDKEAYRIPPTFLPQDPTLESYTQILIWTSFPRYFFNSTFVSLSTAVDGCNTFSTFWRIILPVITPGMVATIIFAFLLAWGDLLWVLVMTSGDSMATVTLGLSRLVTQFRIIWPQLMAGSVIGSLPPLILYLVLQNSLVKGLTAGAVKE